MKLGGMEMPEVPTEHLHEHMHHNAHGAETWVTWVALSSAILAAFAAITALLAGHHANEAVIEQIAASDQWNFYQAKSIKESLLVSKGDILEGMGREPSGKDKVKLLEYKKEKEGIQHLAREKETASHHHLTNHVMFARGLTFFQVAIAVGAISALTKRRRYWVISLFVGALGLVFLVQGLAFSLQKPAAPEKEAHAAAEPGGGGDGKETRKH